MKRLLVPGNAKLGHVPSFSIPAGKTCPGKTEICTKHCYAMKNFFKMSSVQQAHRKRLAATKRKNFVERVIEEIGQLELELLRIHVAGDFYDAPYVRKWIKIVQACPDTQFYAYTRSWRKTNMLAALKELASLPNMQLWWSVDKDSHAENGRPPRVRGVNVAYMQADYDEKVPSYVNLVFRVKRHGVQKFINGKIVCPVEQGTDNDITCEKCRMCFNGQKLPVEKPKLVQLV